MSNLLEKASIILTPTAYSDGTLHSIKPLQTLGSELGDESTISNSGDAVMTKTSLLNYNATSGGTQIYSVRPRLLFNNITLGKKYKITIKATNRSGTILLKLYDGSSYIIDNNDLSSDIDLTFVAQSSSTVQFNFDGREVFNVDLEISLKEVINADFDFSRPTTGSATGIGSRENSSGNIESVAANLPRIDYLGGTGHILLEPQSTNTATYSNDFTQGDIFVESGNPSLQNSVLSANQSTSPDGTNTAQKLTDNNDGGIGEIALFYTNTHLTSGEPSTLSMFVKKDTVRYFIIRFTSYDTSQDISFDLDTGTVNRGTGVMTDYGGGWYRCSATFTTTTDLVGSIRLYITENALATGGTTRNGTKSTFLWGLQAEEQSFPTSYIPTSGSAVTRSADVCNNSGSSDLINSTEGVLYAEIKSLNQILAQPMFITLSNATTRANTVEIGFDSGTNRCRFRVREGSAAIFSKGQSISDITQFTKIAIKYKSGNIKCFINGSEVQADTTSFSFTSLLSELNFDRGDGADNFLYGKVKCVAVFKEALTDAELQCLTS